MKHRLVPILARMFLAFLAAVVLPRAAQATIYTGVLNASNISKLKAGDTLLVPYSVTTAQTLIWGIQGTVQSPITIKGLPSSTGQLPVLQNTIAFYSAGNIIFDSFIIHNAPSTGVVIEQGSAGITIQNCQIYSNTIGIWIGNAAGMSHRILNNSIYSNQIQGIAIAQVDNAPGKQTIILGNQIYQNGSHGIEINGNYYIVDHNLVWDNGLLVPGSSGIHTYASNSAQGEGQHNIITYNISFLNKDNTTDGNGIQLDQWCDNNLVAFNSTFLNDGAGIVLFDAANNMVYNNTLGGNMQDPARQHPYKGDLVLATDYVHNVNHTFNNNLFNNLILTISNGAVPVYIDRLTSANNNVLGNQDMFTIANPGELYFWSSSYGADISVWNSLKAGNIDFQLYPQFNNLNSLPSGFSLASGSPLTLKGSSLSAASLVDLMGTAVNPKTPPIGAYTSVTSTNAALSNGTCGSSNGKIFSTPPASNLCSSGTAMITPWNPWNWVCLGLNGGANTSCSASVQSPTSCGTHANGTTYTLQVFQALQPQSATTAQCPYGGTNVTLTTTTQNYLCSNGTPVAQGSPVSTTSANVGLLACNEPAVKPATSLTTSLPSSKIKLGT